MLCEISNYAVLTSPLRDECRTIKANHLTTPRSYASFCPPQTLELLFHISFILSTQHCSSRANIVVCNILRPPFLVPRLEMMKQTRTELEATFVVSGAWREAAREGGSAALRAVERRAESTNKQLVSPSRARARRLIT